WGGKMLFYLGDGGMGRLRQRLGVCFAGGYPIGGPGWRGGLFASRLRTSAGPFARSAGPPVGVFAQSAGRQRPLLARPRCTVRKPLHLPSPGPPLRHHYLGRLISWKLPPTVRNGSPFSPRNCTHRPSAHHSNSMVAKLI